MQFKKIIKWLSAATATVVLATGLLLGGAYGVIEHDGNFHAVESGQVYRSAQLDGEDLTRRIQENGIKSVLNLRGESPGSDWYDQELAASRSQGVTHLDYRMSAGKPLSLEQMQEVLRMIEQAPKPILIHCKAGADRTGLISAIYLANQGASMERVQEALSVRYGHLPILHWSSTIAMDQSLELFLSQRGMQVTPQKAEKTIHRVF